jgi:type II secretory pathway pseudopilin PulG
MLLSRSTGHSLVEVLISLGIMSLALVAFATVGTSSLKAQDKMDKSLEASLIADRILSRAAHLYQTQDGALDSLGTEIKVGETRFRYQLSSTTVLLPSGSTSLKMLKVRVAWHSDAVKPGSGQQHLVRNRLVGTES